MTPMTAELSATSPLSALTATSVPSPKAAYTRSPSATGVGVACELRLWANFTVILPASSGDLVSSRW